MLRVSWCMHLAFDILHLPVIGASVNNQVLREVHGILVLCDLVPSSHRMESNEPKVSLECKEYCNCDPKRRLSISNVGQIFLFFPGASPNLQFYIIV